MNDNKISIGGSADGAVIIAGDQNSVEQTMGRCGSFEEAFAELRVAVEQIQADLAPDDAEEVAADLERIEKAAGREKPNVERIKSTTESLASTFKNAGEIAKSLIPLAEKVGTAASQFV